MRRVQRQAAPEYSGAVSDPSAPANPPGAPWLVGAGLVVGVLAVSTSSILIRLADAPPLAISFWRCALGALALAPFAARARTTGGALDRAQRRQIVASGLFLAAHFAAFITSLSLTTVASAAVLVTAAPLFVGIGAAIFLDEPPTRKTWWGIGLAIVGAGGIAVADADGFAGRDVLIGDALAFAGAALVAGYLLIGRVSRSRLPVSRYATGVYGVAAVALLVASLATGSQLTGYTAGTWLAIAGLVIGPQLLGHTIFNTLLVAVPATVIAVVILAEPVGSTILAMLVLDEAPAPGFWFTAPLLAAGVWLSVAGSRSAARADVASREPGTPADV